METTKICTIDSEHLKSFERSLPPTLTSAWAEIRRGLNRTALDHGRALATIGDLRESLKKRRVAPAQVVETPINGSIQEELDAIEGMSISDTEKVQKKTALVAKSINIAHFVAGLNSALLKGDASSLKLVAGLLKLDNMAPASDGQKTFAITYSRAEPPSPKELEALGDSL